MLETVSITETTEKQRKKFSCGAAPLDEYLRQFAKGNHTKNLGKTFVLIEESSIVGFYTTSMGSVDFQSIPLEISLKLPKYPIPIARVGRLAVDIKKQGCGWGEFLLIDALHRIRKASESVAAFGVVVDAKDEKAKAFYVRLGFKAFIDNDLSLFIPITSIPN